MADSNYIKFAKNQFRESEIPSLIQSLEAFYEAKASEKIWYTGRNSKSQVFSYDYVGGKEATDQEGPGFYFTSHISDARMYAGKDGIIITCKVDAKRLCPKKGKPNPHIINTLLRNAPDLEDTLTNWGDTTEKAFRYVYNLYLQDDSPLNAYMQIWYDFYRYNPREYLHQISKFYTGHSIKRTGGVEHLIVYDPKKITILDYIDVKEDDELVENYGLAEYPFTIRPAFNYEHEELKKASRMLQIPYKELTFSFYNGNLDALSEDDFKQLQNYEVFEPGDLDLAREIALKNGAKANEWKMILIQFMHGDPIQAPIVLYREGEKPFLVAGHSQLSLMRGKNVTPIVWKICC